MLPTINSAVLPEEWSLAVVNCISDGNTLYDAVFEGQAVYLDVEEASKIFLMNCSLVPTIKICPALLTKI